MPDLPPQSYRGRLAPSPTGLLHVGANGQNAPAVSYRWRISCGWSTMTLEAEGDSQPLNDGSEQEFITEHYWGYAASVTVERWSIR
jgi:hypothetical protein